MYAVKVTLNRNGNNEQHYWYSATRGLVPIEQTWLRTLFDSEEGVRIACRLLNKTRSRRDWFLQ